MTTESLPKCARRITWAGGEHTFDLSDPDIIRLLETRDVVAVPTPFLMTGRYGSGLPLRGQYGDTASAALKRFEAGVYTVNDVECILELGLWGGGDVSAEEALKLVDDHVRGQPLAPSVMVAYEVLAALFIGAAAKAAA